MCWYSYKHATEKAAAVNDDLQARHVCRFDMSGGPIMSPTNRQCEANSALVSST